METESAQNELLITLTSDIVAAHVSNNSVAVSDVSTLIQNVHAALAALNEPVETPEDLLEDADDRRVKPQVSEQVVGLNQAVDFADAVTRMVDRQLTALDAGFDLNP